MKTVTAMTTEAAGILMALAMISMVGTGCGTAPAPRTVLNEIVGRDGAPMVLIPAGEFMMGSEKRARDEKPVHKVYLDAYYIDKYEVTFDLYDKFCEATGRRKPSDKGLVIDNDRLGTENYVEEVKSWGRGSRPVINVSWDDAKAYCEWAGKRLPTEAEWERACRAGATDTEYSLVDDAGQLGSYDNYAWYGGNSGKILFLNFNCFRRTHPVGKKLPNSFGLYDMHGNVSEWVADWYDEGYYAVSPRNSPPGPALGTERIERGGSWRDGDLELNSTRRFSSDFLGGVRLNWVPLRIVRGGEVTASPCSFNPSPVGV